MSEVVASMSQLIVSPLDASAQFFVKVLGDQSYGRISVGTDKLWSFENIG